MAFSNTYTQCETNIDDTRTFNTFLLLLTFVLYSFVAKLRNTTVSGSLTRFIVINNFVGL